jgi:hypothetical protein
VAVDQDIIYNTADYSVKIGTAGDGTITVRTHARIAWIVAQISAEIVSPGTAPSGATGDIRKNGRLVTPFIPTADAPSGEPYVFLRSTDILTINWYDCTPNTVGQATVYYREA